MTATCEIVNREASPSVVIRTRCSVDDLPQVIGPAYARLGAHLAANGSEAAGPPYVAYHNDDMQALEIEIGFPLAEPLAGEGEIEAGGMPGGRFASTLHHGPYHQIKAAYDRLGSWMEAEGLAPQGSCFEVYLNDPADTEANALETLILFPLT